MTLCIAVLSVLKFSLSNFESTFSELVQLRYYIFCLWFPKGSFIFVDFLWSVHFLLYLFLFFVISPLLLSLTLVCSFSTYLR